MSCGVGAVRKKVALLPRSVRMKNKYELAVKLLVLPPTRW